MVFVVVFIQWSLLWCVGKAGIDGGDEAEERPLSRDPARVEQLLHVGQGQGKVQVQVICYRKEWKVLFMGANYLEFEWSVPNTGLKFALQGLIVTPMLFSCSGVGGGGGGWGW